MELERLTVERRAQATPLRVEQLARQQLQMRNPPPGITQYVVAPGGAAAPALREASR
jgi:cell division protein FtsL